MSVFSCPIFGVDTNLAACSKLMDMVWMGKRVDVRKGCQACMASSKCPVVNMVFMNRVRWKTGNLIEIHDKLPKELLERIRPIIVMDRDLNRYGVTPAERERILGANDRIDAIIGRAPSADTVSRRRTKTTTKPAASKPAPVSKNDQAAASGDLGAAISQAA